MSKQLILASNNAKKLRELQALIAPLGVELVTQGALGIPEAEEPHVTFVENALAKARHAARLGDGPALADDSGLCVNALGGAPGVRSARYAVDAGRVAEGAGANTSTRPTTPGCWNRWPPIPTARPTSPACSWRYATPKTPSP